MVKRTTIISAWLPGGGIEKVILNLIHDKSVLGDLEVISLSNHLKYKWFKEFNLKIKFIPCFRYNNSFKLKISSLFRAFIFIRRYLNHNTTSDVILCTNSFLLFAFLFRKKTSKIFYWPHNLIFTETKTFKNLFKKLYYRIISKGIDGVICVNESIFFETSSLGFKNRFLTYNPIGENIEDKFDFKPSSKTLVHIAFLDKRKNTSFIIDALATSTNKSLRLKIIGEGDLKNSLREQVIELGLQDRVSFEGFIDLNATKKIEAAALIMASKSEGFSMVISDAMKSGIPTILPKNLDQSKIIQNNNAMGRVFSLEESQSLTEIFNYMDWNNFDSNEIKKFYLSQFGRLRYNERMKILFDV